MIAFPHMLISAAEQAGMLVPKDPDNYDEKNYPHFYVFCMMQLGKSTPYPGVHFDNAKIIANINNKDIKRLTTAAIYGLGFR